jgi:hypothetical protein
MMRLVDQIVYDAMFCWKKDRWIFLPISNRQFDSAGYTDESIPWIPCWSEVGQHILVWKWPSLSKQLVGFRVLFSLDESQDGISGVVDFRCRQAFDFDGSIWLDVD